MLVTQDEIIKITKKGQEEGKTFVVTNGCFDIIVMLNSDKSVKAIKGDSRPINCEADRAEILSSLRCVDYVVLFDENSPAELLEKIKPDVYTKGADYTLETLPERDIVLRNNIKVEFIEFVEGKSTTNVIKKISK